MSCKTSTHVFLLLKTLSLTPSGLASLSQVADLTFVDTAHENSAHLGLALAQLTHFVFCVPAIHGSSSIHTAGNHVNKSIHCRKIGFVLLTFHFASTKAIYILLVMLRFLIILLSVLLTTGKNLIRFLPELCHIFSGLK